MSLLEVYDDIFGTLLLEAANKSNIISAIYNRKIVSIYYEGDATIKKGWRKIYPCVFGVSKAGNPVIRAYQIEGPSDSEDVPYFRMFRVDRIKNWNNTFKKMDLTNPEFLKYYNKNGDKDMVTIYHQLDIDKKY